MSQDPTKFPEPKRFKPERFLQENSHSVAKLSFAFGSGRRVWRVARALAFSSSASVQGLLILSWLSVGRHFADASWTLWISIVSLLAVFRFDAPTSWNAGPDGVNVKWTEGITTCVPFFPFNVVLVLIYPSFFLLPMHPEGVPYVIKLRHEEHEPRKARPPDWLRA